MIAIEIVPGLYQVPLRWVNAYLLVHDGEVTVLDTGWPGWHERILEAANELRLGSEAIRAIVVTHLHPDHAGGLRALRDRTGATVYAHPLDARAIRGGTCIRDVGADGPWIGRVLSLADRTLPIPAVSAAEVDVELEDGAWAACAGGLRVLHALGHSAGQIALLWPRHGGVLFAADAAVHRLVLRGPPFFEDPRAGRATLRRLASLQFDVAVFGHGRPIRSGAGQAFRDRFGARSA